MRTKADKGEGVDVLLFWRMSFMDVPEDGLTWILAIKQAR